MPLAQCTFHTQENTRVKCLAPDVQARFPLGAGMTGEQSDSQGLPVSSSGGGHDRNL